MSCLHECTHRRLLDYNITSANRRRQSLKPSFTFRVAYMMNVSRSNNVLFYYIIILLSSCEEQLMDCLNPVCRRILSFYRKISGFKIDNNCCNRQGNLAHKYNSSNV
jgi:hypothetical protein